MRFNTDCEVGSQSKESMEGGIPVYVLKEQMSPMLQGGPGQSCDL